MSSLGPVLVAIENHRKAGLEQVRKARTDHQFGERVLEKWRKTKAKIGLTVTATGLQLPRLALPDLDDPGEIARFIWDEGLPGEFPYLTAAYAEQYLEPARTK